MSGMEMVLASVNVNELSCVFSVVLPVSAPHEEEEKNTGR
jgi:hypothetical protein